MIQPMASGGWKCVCGEFHPVERPNVTCQGCGESWQDVIAKHNRAEQSAFRRTVQENPDWLERINGQRVQVWADPDPDWTEIGVHFERNRSGFLVQTPWEVHLRVDSQSGRIIGLEIMGRGVSPEGDQAGGASE